MELTGFTRFGEVTSERAEHTKFHINTETFNHANRADEGDHSYALVFTQARMTIILLMSHIQSWRFVKQTI